MYVCIYLDLLSINTFVNEKCYEFIKDVKHDYQDNALLKLMTGLASHAVNNFYH